MSKPIPTVGRRVHFHFVNRHGELVTRPATVVRRWGDTAESAVNLQVLVDGANDCDTPDGANGLMWRTSVLEAPGGSPQEGTWTWPPRAPESTPPQS